jgi:SGNH domain (fused to AT3 domains)
LPRLVPFGAGAVGLALVLSSAWLANQPQLMFDKETRALSRRVAQARFERGRNYKDKCHLGYEQTEQPLCAYGDVTAKRTVVLFGDSHASQWFEAVDAAARRNGWRLLAWTKSACPPADATIWRQQLRAPFVACDQWREGVLARLTGSERPDLVLVASYVDSAVGTLDAAQVALPPEQARARWRDGLARTIDRLQAAGSQVVVIADTPRARRRFNDCLAFGGGAACGRPRAEALPSTRLDYEAAALAGAAMLDLTDRICGPDTCPATVGGRFVYRDEHHISSRFAASLGDAFLPVLLPLPSVGEIALRGSSPAAEPLPAGPSTLATLP